MVGVTVDILDALTIRDVVVDEMVDMMIVAMLVDVDAVITTEEMESDMVETKILLNGTIFDADNNAQFATIDLKDMCLQQK